MRLFASRVKMYFEYMKEVKNISDLKRNRKGTYCCDECSHRIQLEAINIFFNREKMFY